jgi:hypothetical protein
MTNLKLQTKTQRVRSDKNTRHSLDNIEISSHYGFSKTRESQYYKAIQKHTTNRKLTTIIRHLKTHKRVPKDWIKRFETTYGCQSVLLQQGDKIIGSRCRKRWCQNCNRQKSAKLYSDYESHLMSMHKDNGLYFVTLTAPTCKERELSSTIEKRIKAFVRIKNNIRMRYKTKLNGFRKLEVTHNKQTDRYHPHFHFIVQGEREAYLLLELWMQQFGEASIKAQDVQKLDILETDKKALAEVFKYATKGVVKDTTDARAEYNIQKSILGRRIYQTYGSLYNIKSEDIKETEQTSFDWMPYKEFEIWKFEDSLIDWTTAAGEKLVHTQQIEYEKQKSNEKRKSLHSID